MNKDEILKDVMPQVRVAARQVANNWPDVVEEDDVTQEIYLRLLEAGDGQVAALENQAKSGLVKLFTKIGQQAASKKRDSDLVSKGEFRYSVDQVRDLLNDGALVYLDDGQSWSMTEDRVTATYDPMSMGTLSEQVDLREGMRRVNSGYAEALFYRYYDMQIPVDASAKTRQTRAVRALTTEMNRSFRRRYDGYDGPGNRQNLTNAAANAITIGDRNGRNSTINDLTRW